MKAIIRMQERFGSFLENGDQANAFRFTEVEPFVAAGGEVVLDFKGVTNMTSSFCNALVANLVAHHPEEFPRKIRFENCEALIRQMILGAVSLGRREAAQAA
jgi:hypothetical protein